MTHITLVLLCLWAAQALASPHRHLLGQQARLSGKAIVISETLKDRSSKHLLAVATAAGKRVLVRVSSEQQLEGIHTGMQIEVAGRWQQPTAGRRRLAGAASPAFEAVTIRAARTARAAPKLTVIPGSGAAAGAAAASAASAAAFAGSGAVPPITLSTNSLVTSAVSTLVIPIAGVSRDGSACPGTTLPRFTAADVSRTVFAEVNPDGATVGGIYNKCSYGKTKLTTANSRVADMVRLPCNGTSNDVPWTFSKCDFDDFNGWADAANAALQARGIDPLQYKYRIYMLPPGTCPFVGLGYIGCDGSYECRSWISGDFWTVPQALAHELGHNLFMGHAGSFSAAGPYDEYADATALMGYCCDTRCPNTPHAWQQGWLSVQQLDGSSLAPGQTAAVQLASQAASGRSGLRVVPSWVTGVDPLFAGYRTAAAGDAFMPSYEAAEVHLYTAPIANSYDARQTTWRASLAAAGDAYELPGTGLVLRLQSKSAGSAALTVCRRGGAETMATCQAGQDNDCNGLVGSNDPACARLLAAGVRPPPPSKLVRRPRRPAPAKRVTSSRPPPTKLVRRPRQPAAARRGQ